jgi:electron transfer flavoprotein alpha subunit
MSNIFAFSETRGGELRKVGLETVTAARTIADATGGGEVHAMVAGVSVQALAPRLGEHGADVVFAVEHAALAHYNAEAVAATVAERIKAGGYRAAVFAASAQGRDLAPRVAAKLRTGLASDVVAVEAQGDAIVVRHPVNTGKVVATLTVKSSPALVSLRPGAVTPAAPQGGARNARVESVAPAIDPATARVVVKELREGNKGKLDLAEAPIIVSGGRGLKAPENFKLVEDLAAAFGNAAVGATRAVTDEGWRPHSDQIGQTGRVVSPQLYVACGISGAIQHLAGMRTSKTIVAINKDKEAPIFKIADYGIVGDVFEVLPALTQAVRAAKQNG